MHPKGYYPPEFRKLAEQAPAIWDDHENLTPDDWHARHRRLSGLLIWASVLGFAIMFWVALFYWWTE